MKKSEIQVGRYYRRNKVARKVLATKVNNPWHEEWLEYQEITNRFGRDVVAAYRVWHCTLRTFAQWAQEDVTESWRSDEKV